MSMDTPPVCFFCHHGGALAKLADVFPHVLKYGIPDKAHRLPVCADSSACQRRQLDALTRDLDLEIWRLADDTHAAREVWLYGGLTVYAPRMLMSLEGMIA